MQMVDDLTSLGPRIARKPVAPLAIAEPLPEQPGDADTVPDDCLVARLEPGDGIDVSFRDDEQVDRRLGIEILEGEHLLVLVLNVGGALACDDAAKHAAGGHGILTVVVY